VSEIAEGTRLLQVCAIVNRCQLVCENDTQISPMFEAFALTNAAALHPLLDAHGCASVAVARLQECRNAGMQEVEQRMELLPRNPWSGSSALNRFFRFALP
jgi:hypothetical protein